MREGRERLLNAVSTKRTEGPAKAHPKRGMSTGILQRRKQASMPFQAKSRRTASWAELACPVSAVEASARRRC